MISGECDRMATKIVQYTKCDFCRRDTRDVFLEIVSSYRDAETRDTVDVCRNCKDDGVVICPACHKAHWADLKCGGK